VKSRFGPALGNVPLFVRLFAWILAAAVAMQLASVALVISMPVPEPSLYSVHQVAAVLRGSRDPGDRFHVSVTGAPPESDDLHSFRDDPFAPLVAARLGVAPDRLLLQLRRGRFPLMAQPLATPQMPLPGIEPEDPRRHFLFGDFVISLRLADGRWRNVEPAHSSSISFWRARALAWILAALLAIAPIAWLLARRVARPIALFAKAAERLGRDPRGAPIEIEGPPEIAEAAAAFNEMQARLSRFVQDQSMLMAAIAHDLRTPLMRLAFRLESAPEQARRAAEADIREMEEMIATVLRFLRNLSQPLTRMKLNLRALAESVVDGFADQGHDVRLLPGTNLVIEADRQAMRSLIMNLVQNALAYGGGVTEVEIWQADDTAWIEVRDRGPGIPEDQVERVFEPFYRLDRSRSRETGGVGLGLASVRAVARAHGGDAVLAPRRGGGTVARVTLPLIENRAPREGATAVSESLRV
jgi:signal transduction histidine kinase